MKSEYENRVRTANDVLQIGRKERVARESTHPRQRSPKRKPSAECTAQAKVSAGLPCVDQCPEVILLWKGSAGIDGGGCQCSKRVVGRWTILRSIHYDPARARVQEQLSAGASEDMGVRRLAAKIRFGLELGSGLRPCAWEPQRYTAKGSAVGISDLGCKSGVRIATYRSSTESWGADSLGASLRPEGRSYTTGMRGNTKDGWGETGKPNRVRRCVGR